jgi:hypothetical protein
LKKAIHHASGDAPLSVAPLMTLVVFFVFVESIIEFSTLPLNVIDLVLFQFFSIFPWILIEILLFLGNVLEMVLGFHGTL